MFSGSIVALVTPMHESGEIDISTLRELILWHIRAGTSAIVVNGTTGESATLSLDEKIELLTAAVETAAGRIKIIAGTGTCSTATTVAETRAASMCGVDGVLVVTPYYNRPTQEGLIKHYEAVADSTSLPVIVYNVPKRTGCDLLPATLSALAHVENIVGIKEATGDCVRVAAITAMSGDRFTLLSGDDGSACEFMKLGGHGVISVVANVAPELCAQMCSKVLSGDLEGAKEIDDKLSSLNYSLMAEPNPIPVKWALAKLGKIKQGIRLPLTPLSEPMHSMVEQGLEKAQLELSKQNV